MKKQLLTALVTATLATGCATSNPKLLMGERSNYNPSPYVNDLLKQTLLDRITERRIKREPYNDFIDRGLIRAYLDLKKEEL